MVTARTLYSSFTTVPDRWQNNICVTYYATLFFLQPRPFTYVIGPVVFGGVMCIIFVGGGVWKSYVAFENIVQVRELD
jgi:hypothetical protein